MNLEQFLLYLHNGAYALAQQLFMHELTLQDRRSLRLVSHAVNNVVLEYPIVTELHISSHGADVDYLHLIASNKRLAVHVKQLTWDHSVHEILLLEQDLYIRYKPFCDEPETNPYDDDQQGNNAREEGTQQNSIAGEHPAVFVWRKLAIAQKRNLERGRDFLVVMALLPHLRNVQSVVFTSHSFRTRGTSLSNTWSPAMLEWHGIPHVLERKMPPPCSCGWHKAFDCYFSPLADKLCRHVIPEISESKKQENRFWHRLPVRGITFFERITAQLVARQKHRDGHANASLSKTPTSLRMVFPKLSSVHVYNIDQDFLTPQDGGPELLFLRRSIAACARKLGMIVPRTRPTLPVDEESWGMALQANVLGAAATLQYLHLGDVARPYEAITASVLTAARLLSRLPRLTHLVLSGGSTTPYELDELARGVNASRSLEELHLFSMLLATGRWKDVLRMWKAKHYMNKMKVIQINGVRNENEVAVGVRALGYTWTFGSKTSLVRWLKGERNTYPMYDETV